jgi:PhnB protein
MPKRSLPGQREVDRLNRAVDEVLRSVGGRVARLHTDPVLRIAQQLRDLPREQFKETLKKNLERSASMATTTATPAGVRTFASPRLAFKNAGKAIEFYKNAFGAKETLRFENELGFGHAEMTIGDSVIMFAEEWPEGGRYSAETWGHSPVNMEISVPDVDAFVEHAVAAGATLVRPAADQFYGYREAAVLDPFGYLWGIYTKKEELSVEEMHRRFQAAMKPEGPKKLTRREGFRTLTAYLVAQDAPGLIDFVKQTFGAEETLRTGPGSAGGLHCELRIEDSMLMIGGGGPGFSWHGDPAQCAFHIYVPDCDATYRRALEAGGTSIDEPADQSYGERSATVKDAAGNHWYIATFKGESYKWEGAPTLQPSLHPLRAEPVINFLKRAFGAQELGRHATPDGVIHHATVKIGDALLEMGEAHGPYQPMPSMFYLYVPDVDAAYGRALQAGGTSIAEPKDQPYGERSGAVKDPFGNQWYMGAAIEK